MPSLTRTVNNNNYMSILVSACPGGDVKWLFCE
jgi:hypothetical protein